MSPRFAVVDIDVSDSVPFVVLTVATASHSDTAARLTNSTRKLGLPHISIEVPTIHRSVSPRGTDGPDYCKASLISTVLAELERPILHLDNVESVKKLKTFWLPRAYVRLAWWIFYSPVLDHPDYPNPGLSSVPLTEFRGRPRVHMEQLTPRLLTCREEMLRDHRFVVGPDGMPHVVGSHVGLV